MQGRAPQISSFSLDESFRAEVINHGLDPNYTWIDGYLPTIWEKDRYYIEAFLDDIHGKAGLELGCNVGATAIMCDRTLAAYQPAGASRTARCRDILKPPAVSSKPSSPRRVLIILRDRNFRSTMAIKAPGCRQSELHVGNAPGSSRSDVREALD
jgi:hypothetical protein